MSHAERLATQYIAFVELRRFCVEFVFFFSLMPEMICDSQAAQSTSGP